MDFRELEDFDFNERPVLGDYNFDPRRRRPEPVRAARRDIFLPSGTTFLIFNIALLVIAIFIGFLALKTFTVPIEQFGIALPGFKADSNKCYIRSVCVRDQLGREACHKIYKTGQMFVFGYVLKN